MYVIISEIHNTTEPYLIIGSAYEFDMVGCSNDTLEHALSLCGSTYTTSVLGSNVLGNIVRLHVKGS